MRLVHHYLGDGTVLAEEIGGAEDGFVGDCGAQTDHVDQVALDDADVDCV